MAGAQNKKDSPGAFRSCLIPYREQIFTCWYKEHKTAREIQKQIAEHFGVDVHWTTVARFIKVRRNKPDPHELPERLHVEKMGLTIAAREAESVDATTLQRKITDSDTLEAEKLLAKLRESTSRQLGIAAEEARQKSKHR